MSEHDLRVVYHDDVILLAWSMPATYYTRAFVEQCTEGTAVNATCIVHDVTSEVTNGLAVNRLNGTSLSLVVYQDRDEVLRLPFIVCALRHGSMPSETIASLHLWQ